MTFFKDNETAEIIANEYYHYDAYSAVQHLLYRVEVEGKYGLVYKTNSDMYASDPVILLRPVYRAISAHKTTDENKYRILVDDQFIGYIVLGKRPEIGIEVEADTLEEARAKIKSQLSGSFRIVAETILLKGEGTVRGTGNTKEEALGRARVNLPENATIVTMTPAQEEVTRNLEIEAFDEQTARAKAESKVDYIDSDWQVQSLRIKSNGSSGFLGIGKKPHHYIVEIKGHLPAMEIVYKTKARIYAQIGENPIN